ncbi:MAG: alpha/beta fold hydrolase [Candidatus Hopanoidivoransaceae bacterium]
MSESVLSRQEMVSGLVTSPLTYDLLVPDGIEHGAPVLLWLHGGDGPDRFAPRTTPAFDRCWSEGSLPPMTVVMPHSTRSFWLDGIGERSAWESMLVEELLPHVRAEHGSGVAAVGGISMGGMGALRVGFRHPERFAAVLAIEPAIEVAAEWDDVSRRDRSYRLGAYAEVFGDPVDAAAFRHNHPLAVMEDRAVDIAASGLAVYLECGDEDLLDLHHGAEALHRRMWDIGLRHEYRSVRGGNHVGRTLGPRTVDALRFLGRSLEADPTPDPEVAAIATMADSAHTASGLRRTTTVAGPAGPIEVHEYGDGEPVLMLPSLGRGAADFDDLARRLARAGYHAIHPEPRGIGGSTGDLTALSMADLAADAAAVIHAVARGPVTIVGHAFGNRVARMTATEYPHLIDSVVLLCCGGLVRPSADAEAALQKVFDIEAPDEEHLAAVGFAFFAPGNDASVWFDGWHGAVAACQGLATAQQPIEHWWGAGGKDLFVVQPEDDVMAVPENAERICEEFGDRASMVLVKHAGHALLPEQPDAVEVALRSWLTRPR